jgi:endonuclease/exonuclease/phosphatase family metal-dependent hydrolase
MIRSLFITISFVFASIIAVGQLKLVNLNIRYSNVHDGENAWSLRKHNTIHWLKKQRADVYFFQEVLEEQLNDLSLALVGYQYYGVGREDGLNKGEFSPIFFKKDRFQIISKKTIWLSPTPSIPSKGWDATCERIYTQVLLYDLQLKDTIALGNTHWDHFGMEARNHSAPLITQELSQLPKHTPVLLGGDFNCNIHDVALENIKVQYHTAGDELLWSAPSFQGFGKSYSSGCIDYVFYNSFWKINSFHSVTTYSSKKKDPKKYISDHNGFVFEFEPRIFE